MSKDTNLDIIEVMLCLPNKNACFCECHCGAVGHACFIESFTLLFVALNLKLTKHLQQQPRILFGKEQTFWENLHAQLKIRT